MSDPAFDTILSGFGGQAVTALKLTLQDSWDSLTPDERINATKLMMSLAKCHLYSIAGYDVKDELEVLGAAFQQWQVVGKQVVVDGAKKAATEVFGLAGAFAGSALAVLLKGII